MSDFGLLGIASSAMQAQRDVLDVHARNLANAQSQTANGPYQRLVPDLQLDDDGIVVFRKAVQAHDPPLYVYEPNNPVALKSGPHKGYVAHPNVDTVGELVAALEANRAYEANASIFDVGKKLTERLLDVERS